MRIGINASFLCKPGTGIGQVSTHFLREMVKYQSASRRTNSFYQNAEYVLYCEEKPQLDFLLPNNFKVRNFLPLWRRDDLIRKILWERRVASEAKKDGCDVFLSLYQSGTATPREMRHTMVVHDLIPRLFPVYQGNFRKKFYWRMVERALRHVDHIVAVSEATKKDLIDFGIVEQKILVASPDTAPGFAHEPTPEESARVMARYGLTPGYIYHGGGLEIRKNAEGLLRAYKLLVEKETAVMTTLPPLVISGKIFQGHNPLATPVTKLIKELGLTERVRLLGFVPESDLPALYKNALFFVYPSLYEGFGLPVLEALRMRTPVLTTDGSSLPEVAGGAAMYVDPTDRAALASGMERLMRDASLREQLCAAAPQAGARFQWQNFVATVLGTFQKENI